MRRTDFSLDNINRAMDQRLNEHELKPFLNYGCVLMQAFDKKLSVTAEYEPRVHLSEDSDNRRKYITLGDYLASAKNGKNSNRRKNSNGENEKCQTGDQTDTSGPSDCGYYYGVSPRVDSAEIRKFVSKHDESIEGFLNRHCKDFMLPDTGPNGNSNKKLLPALAKYIVICMMSNFGLRFVMSEAQREEIENDLRSQKGFSSESLSVIWSVEPIVDGTAENAGKDCVVTVKGRPFGRLFKWLKGYRYKACTLERRNGKLHCNASPKKDGEKLNTWQLVPRGTEDREFDPAGEHSAENKSISINKVYREYVELLGTKVFYSGVLLKPTELTLINNSNENDRIRSLQIHFERTTYGTVLSLDRDLSAHPMMNENERNLIRKMFRKDDEAKNTLCKNLDKLNASDAAENSANHGIAGDSETDRGDSSKTDRLYQDVKDQVNKYLKACYNVNQICVSANIITGEGVLILGERSSNNIDSNTLYPGVNGNAELADDNVSFYRESVYEDFPTIRTDDKRIDFFGEIGREAFAELKLNLTRQEWNCCGITLSGNRPVLGSGEGDDAGKTNKRRMHFNLIFEHVTEKTYSEIDENSKKAAEAFETGKLRGIKVIYERNRFVMFWKLVLKTIVSLVQHKDFVEAMIAFLVFFLTLANTMSGEDHELSAVAERIWKLSWTEATALVIALLVITVSVIRITKTFFGMIRKWKMIHHIRIFRGMKYDDVSGVLNKALRSGKKEFELHPATYACLRTYVDRVIYDSIFHVNRRI